MDKNSAVYSFIIIALIVALASVIASIVLVIINRKFHKAKLVMPAGILCGLGIFLLMICVCLGLFVI